MDKLSLRFHFNRKFPLVTYSMLRENPSTKSCSSDSVECNVILQVKPSFSAGYPRPPVLVTGSTPITQIGKIEDIKSEPLSVFVVPHQESKECLSLLPENTRKELSNPASLANAALHLALYHMRESLNPGLGRLTGQMKEKGKDFRKHWHCKPEADLAAMLQGPDAKICPFIQSEYVDAQLKLYKNQKQKVFSSIAEAISEEEGKQQRRIIFLRDSLAWAYFYRHICAEVYVMSAEDLKQEARLEVLNGIIIANIWRQTRCSIVITDCLQCPLSEVIQRDVRKLAFPDTAGSKHIVRVGFLNRNFPRNLPFFTINPWSQAQSHVLDQCHTISVDTSKHAVSGLGDEHPIHLIRDELDLREGISTEHSNMIIGYIDDNRRPLISRSRSVSEDDCSESLEKYLDSICYEGTQGLGNVLDCLIGPSLVRQLRYINIPDMIGIIPALLQRRAYGSFEFTKFTLTPTGSSASEAKVNVYIPQRHPLQIGDRTVESATFIVKNARTQSVEITLKVSINSKPFSHKVSEHLDPKGSCGKTVADHVYGICSKDEAWLHAKTLTVGEVLHVFLCEEKALMVIQSLPLFLSFPLSKCKIKHYLTTVLVDSLQTLKEGHIHASPFELSTAFINNHKLLIQVESLALHIFPLSDVDKHMVQLEGNCTVNKIIPMKFTCTSTPDSQKHAHFFFADSLPATKVFELLGIEISPMSLTRSIIGSKLELDSKVTYNAGFVLSQPLGNTEEVSLTSLFFHSQTCRDVEGLLPPTLRHIQHAKEKTVLHFPSAATPVLGLEVAFTSKLEVPGYAGVENMMLECCLCVCPSIVDHSYTYEVTVRQHSNQSEQQKLKGMSIYATISALCDTIGKNVAEQVGSIPKLGDQILQNVSLRKIVLQLVNTEIILLELHTTLPELQVVPGKLSMNNCALKMSYSKDDLTLECSGNLVFLRRYKYSGIRFSFPTANKKGKLSFRSYKDLILENLMEEFGWLSGDVKFNAILAKVLDCAVRKVALEFHFTTELQITSLNISIFKEALDIGVVKFRGIELDVLTELVNGRYVTRFSLNAYISDGLYAELKYSPDSCILTGSIKVTYSKLVSAMDVLQVFKSPTDSYVNMKRILQKEFMHIFKSDLNISVQPGMTAFLRVSIRLPSPSEFSKHCSLEHLKLEVEDALKIVCDKDSYVLNTFQFEYLNKPQPTHLSLVVHKVNAKENMTLDFDFTSHKNNVFKAIVKRGPAGGFLKLSSAIDLARTTTPEVPNFDVGLPPIFDIELSSGSVTFNLRPSFLPSAFDINILISEWQLFSDPQLTVHNLTLKTTWKSGSCPQLSFTDCSLTFFNHQLDLSGRINSEEVYIKCSSAKKLSEGAQFESIIERYTPSSQLPQPVLPTDIGLPSMEVKLKELIIQLKRERKTFRVNARCTCRSPWEIGFGSRTISVYGLGGALKWEKREETLHSYKAFLYGTIELLSRQRLEMELLLGSNIDSIISAPIKFIPPKCLHYGQVIDHLLGSDEKYDVSTSGLSKLVPPSMTGISFTSASTALNVTGKKQFFLSSEVQGWGSGSILIGYLVSGSSEMDYIVSLSLDKDQEFKFGRLSRSESDSIALIDKYLQLQSIDILVSSTDLKSLSSLTEQFCHSFSQSQQVFNQPFYKSENFTIKEMARYKISTGTTIYAKISIAHSEGISKLLELGDTTSLEDNILVMAFVGRYKPKRDIEIHAWLPQIKLFKILEFTGIHLIYKIQKESEFELIGTVALDLVLSENVSNLLKFDGNLLVCSTFAEFSTDSCEEVVSEPCGINIMVNNLKLGLKMHLDGKIPELHIHGSLTLCSIPLTCEFLLNGTDFNTFKIYLESGLTLSALFECTSINWKPVELNIRLKEGHLLYYHADSDIKSEDNNLPYKDGYHLEAVITLFDSDFEITADIPSDRSDIVLSTRHSKPVDFGFARITSSPSETDTGLEGPKLSYNGMEGSLTLSLGVELLKHSPPFKGELKYISKDTSLEGTVSYPEQFLWIKKPSMTVRWSEDDGFEIGDFSFSGNVPGFSLLKAVEKFAKVIHDLIKNIFSCSIKLHLKTDKNPDPKEYLLKMTLHGEFTITVIGFDIPVFSFDAVSIFLPKTDDFSYKKLPQYILRCLWNSAGSICNSLLDYISAWDFLENPAHVMWSGIKGAYNTVVNVTKKLGLTETEEEPNSTRKIWRGIRSESEFILDLDNGFLLGYIREGKGGRELCDKDYTAEQFGPVLTVCAIGAMAHDVHKYYKSCIEAQDDEKMKLLHDEMDGEEVGLDKGLDKLKGKAEELSKNLIVVADNILTVNEVSIRTDDRGDNVLVDWFVYNPEENTYYNEDKGDIEYFVKVTATVIEGDSVKLISIYDDIFLNVTEEEDGSPREDDSLMEERTTSTAPTAETLQLGEDKDISKTDKKEEDKDPNEVTSEEDPNVDDISEDGESFETCNSEIEDDEPPILKKLISLKVPFDPDIESTVSICARIQPKVTLQVMLPPNTITTEEHMINLERLESGDTSWMDDAKKEIDEHGSINEVTLEGKVVCEQQLIQSLTESKLQFTAECTYQGSSLLVSGSITIPVPEAQRYLVQLVDETDLTVIIKQSLLQPPILHYKMEASFSEFPDTSSGPYQISIIGLRADLTTCSAFTDSELKVTRYCAPVGLTEILPNLNSSDSDTVRLEWRHPKPRKLESKDSHKDEEDHGTEPDHESQPVGHFYTVTITGISIKKPTHSAKQKGVSIKNITESDRSEEAFQMNIPVQDSQQEVISYEFSLADTLKKRKYKLQDGLLFRCQVITNGNLKLQSMPKLFSEFILLAPPMNLKVTSAGLHANPVQSAGPHVDPVQSAGPHVDPVQSAGPHVDPVQSAGPHVDPVQSVGPHVDPVQSVVPHVDPVLSAGPHVDPVQSAGPHVDPVQSAGRHVDPVQSAGPHVDPVQSAEPHVDPVQSAGPHVDPVQSAGPHVDPVQSAEPHVDPVQSAGPHVDPVQSAGPHVQSPGLHIGWEYSVHAIGYRIELVDEHSKERAFSKMLKCETGSHGEAVLSRNDFKDIPYTSSNSGYRLQMYSLGFGQDLIRCLEPSVAEGIFHVIPAELQYLDESMVVRVKFRPFANVRSDYIVQLWRVRLTESDKTDYYQLTASDLNIHDETVRDLDFPLKEWWDLLQSGDLVIAWVSSILMEHCSCVYIGCPQEEVCVLNSPDLKTSPTYNSDGSLSPMKLTWSEVEKAQSYQYGYYLPDKKEYISLMETEEREAVVDFSCHDYHQFQMYVTALGQPGAFVAGELTLTVTLQSIKTPSLEHHKAVTFTSISLQQVWWQHLIDHAFSHYCIPKALNTRTQHFLFPSGKLFPSLKIPKRFMKKFWRREYNAPFGYNGKN